MVIFTVNDEFDFILWFLCVVIILLQGSIAGLITAGSTRQYKVLKKPKISPPAMVFPIVWNILFVLIATAVYRIMMLWTQGYDVKIPLILFLIQMVLNFMWSIIFFKYKERGLAALELILLIIFIILTIIYFFMVDKIAAYLMLPYLLWSIFALYLNYSIWDKNRLKVK